MTTQELIDCHCHLGTKISGKKIPVRDVVDMPLRTIMFIMQRPVGIQELHQASREHMLYALEAMEPTMFNWEEAFLPVLKDQLTNVGKGSLSSLGMGPF